MIYLDKELEDLFEKEYTYVLVRNNTNIKCSCWRKESNTPDPSCINCDGYGYVYKEYLPKSLVFYTTIDAVSHMQDFEYGKSYSNILTSYFESNNITNLFKMNDLIFEIDILDNGNIIRKRKWLITDYFSFKLEHNKRQFIKCLSKPLPI